MYKKFFLMGVVLFGALCSSAFGAGTGIHAEQQTNPKMYAPVQDVNQFDVSGEIAALKKAKAEMVSALKACGDDDQKYMQTINQFKAKENTIFAGLANRRRAEYAKVHFEVTRHGRAWAENKRTVLSEHRYAIGDYRIDCPILPEGLVLIPGSCRWIEHSRKDDNGGGARIENPREENNGYTVGYWVKGPDEGHADSHLDFTIIALYRYNDATLTKLVNADMATLRKRVEDGAK